MNVLLIANGEVRDYEYIKHFIKGYGRVYCCDGGVRHCEKLSLFPNVIVGDFDSSSEIEFDKYVELGAEIFKFPAEKDCTDTELCILKAIDDGAKSIIILGGLGKRFDHALANAHILKHALENNVAAKLIDEHSEIFLIDKEAQVKDRVGGTISLIPLTTEAKGVTITGVKYPLFNHTLKVGSSFSVSNFITENIVNVSISSGNIFVIIARD